jgi:hypothetical protein
VSSLNFQALPNLLGYSPAYAIIAQDWVTQTND